MSRPGPMPPRLPKLCGGDVELGNFTHGIDRVQDSCLEASRQLLREIDGLPLVSRHHAAYCRCPRCRPEWRLEPGRPTDRRVILDPQDWGRRFLPANGGCVYVDLGHLELCLPEVRSAREHVAAWHAMLRIARRALAAANSRQPDGQRIVALVNNSDGRGHSYGGHLNFLITRRSWDNLFRRRLHHMLFLASYQVSSVLFTGQGKVGSENGRPPARFQLSQRADFFETLTGEQTTHNRTLVNARDEPHGGRTSAPRIERAAAGPARLHVIFYDSNLSHVACFLKVGVLQLVLAMIEQEQVDADLTLDDPLEALVAFGRDPSLRVTAATADGRRLSALDLQWSFLERAKRFVADGRAEETVPECAEIVRVWEETLAMLESGDLALLARRLDWALKLSLIQRTLERRTELEWTSPEIKQLDHLFADLDESSGLYWSCERAGAVELLATEERISALTTDPPADTRAWTRAMLLRRAAGSIDDVGWDFIRFRIGGWGHGARYRRLELPDPLAAGRSESGPIFERAGSLERLLDGLGATSADEAGAREFGTAEAREVH